VKDFREEVKDAVRRGKWFIRVAYNPNTAPKWAENIIVLKSKVPGIDGKTVAEVAAERDADQWDTYFDIIAEDPYTRGATGTLGPRKPYLQYWTHPRGMVGLDTSVFDKDYQGKSPPYNIPGINPFSAFPMFYIKYVRDGDVLTMEEAVQKTATMAAVLMDLPNLKVLSTEIEPRQHPEGIEYVMVNGTIAVDKGKYTGKRAGRVLTREK